MKNKIPMSKIILITISIGFVLFFFIILIFSIGTAIFSKYDIITQKNWNSFISFFHRLSEFDTFNDPISIFIEILSSIGGVFFGIRIGQWIDNKEELEQLSDLWNKIYSFLSKLKNNVNNKEISICELAEYKIYWDSLQRADNIATRFLQNDNRYVDISYAFSFLTFYNSSWKNYSNINEWKDNASDIEKVRIQKWIDELDNLIEYAKIKSNIT